MNFLLGKMLSYFSLYIILQISKSLIRHTSKKLEYLNTRYIHGIYLNELNIMPR